MPGLQPGPRRGHLRAPPPGPSPVAQRGRSWRPRNSPDESGAIPEPCGDNLDTASHNNQSGSDWRQRGSSLTGNSCDAAPVSRAQPRDNFLVEPSCSSGAAVRSEAPLKVAAGLERDCREDASHCWRFMWEGGVSSLGGTSVTGQTRAPTRAPSRGGGSRLFRDSGSLVAVRL